MLRPGGCGRPRLPTREGAHEVVCCEVGQGACVFQGGGRPVAAHWRPPCAPARSGRACPSRAPPAGSPPRLWPVHRMRVPCTALSSPATNASTLRAGGGRGAHSSCWQPPWALGVRAAAITLWQGTQQPPGSLLVQAVGLPAAQEALVHQWAGAQPVDAPPRRVLSAQHLRGRRRGSVRGCSDSEQPVGCAGARKERARPAASPPAGLPSHSSGWRSRGTPPGRAAPARRASTLQRGGGRGAQHSCGIHKVESKAAHTLRQPPAAHPGTVCPGPAHRRACVAPGRRGRGRW